MATVPRRFIDNYTRSLEELSAGAQEALAERLAQVDYSDMSRAADEIVGIMEETCSISADASAEIAAAFYNGMSQYQTGTPYEAAPVSAHLAEGTEKATRGIFQKAVDGDVPSMTTQLLERADYEVKRAAGRTVLDNSIADPRKPRYARVPSGIETCDFCIMLASRGFVYRSNASAGEINHYHSHCRCRIVPGFGDVEVEGYDPEFYYRLYKNPSAAEDWRLGNEGGDVQIGIFRRIDGNHTIAEDLRATNPGYASGNVEWTHNCQRCVPTYEMRRRGFDVTAIPRVLDANGRPSTSDPVWLGWRDIFDNATWESTSGTGQRRIERLMEEWGDGSRAQIYVKWKGRNTGAHVFVAERIDGETRYVDPQSGSQDASGYFGMVRTGSTRICRLDTLQPSDAIMECCEDVK